MNDTLVQVIVFLFGAIIGSFLNVVALRYRTGKTLGGRSMCFSCGKTLLWYELVPLGSFLTQRGKCHGCKTPISWQYPVVEAVTGFMFVFLYMRFEYLLPANATLFGILFAFYALVFSVLLVACIYDVRHKILPDPLNLFFGVLAFVSTFMLQGDAIVFHSPELSTILAGIVLPAPFVLMWIFSKGRLMGLGDAKLMVGMGLLLGFSSGVTALLLAFWIGALASILMVIRAVLMGKKMPSMTTAIPFGPFLVLATFIVFVSSLDIVGLIELFTL